ncbi:MAG: enoyl-CoA hydratase/isomerase family protein [Maricaulaceae bacterium]|jgi:enoyl-CoA hydratase/carnithine racemase
MAAHDDADHAILYSEENGVGVITLNRPDALNTFRHADYLSLLHRLDEIGASTSVRALVITGRGRAFSAGQDLRELEDGALPPVSDQIVRLEELQDITRRLIGLDVPTITAFNGFAVGAGLEIAIACDFRIAVPDAYFLFAEASRGLFPTNGVLWLLPRLVGPAHAKELLLFARKFDAEYGYRTGLVNEIVAPEKLLARAVEMATDLSENSSDTIRGVKRLLRSTFEMSLEDMLREEIVYNTEVMSGADFAEGVNAFFEKRPPVFKRVE